MTKSRWAVMVQCGTALAAIIAAGGPSALAAISSVDIWVLVATTLAAAAVLSGLSVWLPRGDAVDNSAALAFMAGAFLPPQLAALVMVAGWLLGMVVSGRGMDLWRTLEQMSRRALLMAGTYAALGYFVRLFHGLALVSGPNGETVQLRTLESGLALIRSLSPTFVLGGSDASLVLFAVAVCGVLFVALDLAIEQWQASVRLSTPYGSLIVGSIRLRGWMVLAEMSVAVLTVLVYPTLGIWGIFISTGMLVIMRRSFVLLRDMQTSYELTIGVLARSLEWSNPARQGHAERVSNMVAEAARRIGFAAGRIENVKYAALFHDVARMGSDETVTEEGVAASEVLAHVDVLGGALPILRMLDSAGHVDDSPDEEDVIGAYLIARFSDIDDAKNTGDSPNPRLSAAIGARLYASTRAASERTIRDVERSVPVLDLAPLIPRGMST